MDNETQSAPSSPPPSQSKKSNNTMMASIAVIVILVVAGGFFFLSKKNQNTQQQTTAEPTQKIKQQVTAQPSSMAQHVKEFTVTGSNFKFEPNILTVNKGDTVKITFKNSEGTHDLTIPDFTVATNKIPAGQEETISFLADKTGTFQYFCSVANHKSMGMVGTLTVK